MHNAVIEETSGRDRDRPCRNLKLDGRSSRVLHMSLRTASICIAFFTMGTAFAAPTVGGCAVFPANNYWNTPVDTLPLHPSSTTWVNSVGATTRLHADWGNVLADNYGIPFVIVPGTQPGVPIVFDPNGYADESDPGPMPIPANAPIEGGALSSGDRHVLVIETGNCILYELYIATPVSGGTSWRVYSSAKFDLKSNALRPDSYTSADAAGLPIFPGLVRWEEVAAGEIAHAIRFTAQRIWGTDAGTGRHKYLWPARHWSGSSTDATRPPMGARFRLKASFDISGFDARTQVILRAFKKYGLVLADAGSNWFFQGVSDTNWPDIVFSQLGSIAGGNFEVVDTSGLIVDPNSAQTTAAGSAANYQGVWWGGSAENGWGLALTQHGNTLVAGWYYYGSNGAPTWTIMPGCAWNAGFTACTGALYNSSGAWLGSYNAAAFAQSSVGTATFTFSSTSAGTMQFTVNGVPGTKEISRINFGSGTAPSAIDYTDVWWGGIAQNGWGVALSQQQAVLVGSWYTYNSQGQAVWYLINGGSFTSANVFAAPLTRATGSQLIGATYNASLFMPVSAGNVTITFSDANNASMSYTVDGVTQSKAISRLPF